MKMMEQQIHHLLKIVIATSADGVRDIHLADMDGDGDMDIVSASGLDDTLPGMKMMERQIQHLLS